MPDDLKAALSERNEALTTLDMAWSRRMIPDASSDDVRLMAMHKARYECTQIAPDLRRESRRWLEKNGCGRFYGQPWPDGDELPA